MSAKSLDPEILKTTVLDVMDGILSKMPAIIATAVPETKEVEIDEYEGRMKATGVGKFESSSFVSVVNFYLNQGDLDKHKGAKGALIFYIDSENGSKIYKALGFKVHEDEDDASMMDACGKVCQLIGEEFKNKLSEAGYSTLLMSAPMNYKNTVLRGAEFSPDQTMQYEFSFFYWKLKTIVIEVSLADLPRKR